MSYTKPSISGYNANPPPDDASETSANTVRWSNHITKIGEPLKSYLDAVNNATESAWNDLASTAAVSDGAALVGYKHGGSTGTFTTGAVSTTVQKKLDAWINVRVDMEATLDGVTDVTTKVQSALTAGAGTTVVIDGPAFISSALNITGDDVHLLFTGDGGLVFSDETIKAINITGARCKVSGGKITGPATFDGTNSEATIAVIWCAGEKPLIQNVHLVNVPRAGIKIHEQNDARIEGCLIEGNFPSASYTGTQTGHAAIIVETGTSGAKGNITITGNIIHESVQGILLAFYGVSTNLIGITIAGNSFWNCWNHGVYCAAAGNGISVAGNAFNQCQVPVALKGPNHSVTGNTLVTLATADTYDETGISLRDAIGCVVVGNSITGTVATDSTVISLHADSGTEVSNNIVSGNSIEITSGTGTAIRVGDGTTATTVNNNVVANNFVIGDGRSSIGLITVVGTTSATAIGNVISGNTVVHTADSYGIGLTSLQAATVTGNSVRMEYDAGSAKTLAGIFLTSCIKSSVTGNTILVTASWGTNVTYRGIWESGSSSVNRIAHNNVNLDATKLSALTPFVAVSGSATIFDETGSGAPNLNAGIGSRWTRTDGGAGTTLYVKESGTDATGWVGM